MRRSALILLLVACFTACHKKRIKVESTEKVERRIGTYWRFVGVSSDGESIGGTSWGPVKEGGEICVKWVPLDVSEWRLTPC